MLLLNHAWKEGRMPTRIETVPQMDVAIQDMEHLVEELCASHALSSPLFQRREQREAAHTSLQGVLSAVPRQSIEPRVLAVQGVVPKAVRAMQACISAGRWDDELLLHQHWKEVERDLGADDGVLMVDGRAVPKQGIHWAGVRRPYWGELGKRANCQAGGVWAMSAPQAPLSWIVGCIGLWRGSQTPRMLRDVHRAAFHPR